VLLAIEDSRIVDRLPEEIIHLISCSIHSSASAMAVEVGVRSVEDEQVPNDRSIE